MANELLKLTQSVAAAVGWKVTLSWVDEVTCVIELVDPTATQSVSDELIMRRTTENDNLITAFRWCMSRQGLMRIPNYAGDLRDAFTLKHEGALLSVIEAGDRSWVASYTFTEHQGKCCYGADHNSPAAAICRAYQNAHLYLQANKRAEADK